MKKSEIFGPPHKEESPDKESLRDILETEATLMEYIKRVENGIFSHERKPDGTVMIRNEKGVVVYIGTEKEYEETRRIVSRMSSRGSKKDDKDWRKQPLLDH